MELKKIAVLSGGISNEREISIMTAGQIVDALTSLGHEVHLIDVTAENIKDGSLFANRALTDSDVVFIALHGKYGEDGRIQSVLDMMHKPYTGSGVLSSASAMNKSLAKKIVQAEGIKTARGFEFSHHSSDHHTIAKKIVDAFGYPCIVKPNESGSSVGVSLVRADRELSGALEKAFHEDSAVMVEEYIRGREFTCGVLGNTHTTDLEPLPVVEIISHADFFDYKSKYFDRSTQEICPAGIPDMTAQNIQLAAVKVHELLACRGLTRSDFVLSDDGALYFLELNTIPGQTQASLCPKEAAAAGMSFPHFLERQVELALE